MAGWHEPGFRGPRLDGWTILTIVAALATVAVLAAPARGDTLGQREAGRPSGLRDASASRCPGVRCLGDGSTIAAIDRARAQTWTCERWHGRAPTRSAGTARRSLSVSYRRWVLDLWRARRDRCHAERRAWLYRDSRTGWTTVLEQAAGFYDVSYGWLRDCNLGEAGSAMIPNHEGSGAFGPMQFMASTFERMARWARTGHARELRTRIRAARHVPPRFWRRDSYVGQAYAAAAGFAAGRSSEWTGHGC